MSSFKFKLSKREKWLLEAVVYACIKSGQSSRLSLVDIREAMLPANSLSKKTTTQMLRFLSMKMNGNGIDFTRVSDRGPSRDAVYGFKTNADYELAVQLKKES